MKKLYYLLFYKLNCFFKTISDDSWSDWKAGKFILFYKPNSCCLK